MNVYSERQKTLLENEEIAGYRHFLLLSQGLFAPSKNFCSFVSILNFSSADAFNFKILSLVVHIPKSSICMGYLYSTKSFLTHSPLKILLNPLPDEKISDWSKSKQTADDFLKCL